MLRPLSFLLDLAARKRLEGLRPRLQRLAISWCHDEHLAEDLVQESFALALQKQGQLRDTDTLEAWLYSLLDYCWRTHVQHTASIEQQRGSLDDTVFPENLDPPTPEQRYTTHQTAERIHRAVARLPLGARQVLTLVDLEECSYAQVAYILDIPVGTVMSRLHRARQALKLEMQRDEGHPTNVRRLK